MGIQAETDAQAIVDHSHADLHASDFPGHHYQAIHLADFQSV